MLMKKLKDRLETLALIAVIPSLILVAYELQQTRKAMQAQTYQTRAIDAIGRFMQMAERPQDLALFEKVEQLNGDLASLSDAEISKLFQYVLATRADADNEHYQFENGFLDEDFYYTTTVADIRVSAPIWRKLGIGELRQSFKLEVDRILSETKPSVLAPSDENHSVNSNSVDN
jgi:hypothetical protein